MAYDIRNVKNITDLIGYFSENLNWAIDIDDFDDIEDISYDFEAEDIGLKEESFAKISSLRQLQPLVDGQKWGIFCIEFDSNKFEVSALRKILSKFVPKRRSMIDHAVWEQRDLLFICNWGEDNNRTIGIAHFEDQEKGLPQIKMISCAPALEDFTQIKVFEDRLSQLAWPKNSNNIEAWREAWSNAFSSGYRQNIQDSSTLTIQLAAEAQNIRNRILAILNVETQNGYVHLLYEKFKNTLIHDMTEQQFADMYAQTVVYGLFSARCMDNSQDDFNAAEAIDCIPNTNPFLKSLMRECFGTYGSNKLSFDELEIGNVVDLLLHTKTDEIIKDFNRQTGGGKEDPVIHFYEEFLTAYDKSQKVQRGVYYTPQPVVNFIVRAVDSILKSEFGYKDGLAATETKKIKVMRESKRRVNGYITQIEEHVEVPAVQILDPATGTGTFLRQTILQIYENFLEKNKKETKSKLAVLWNEYVDKNLLPRLNGFELMMAPYAVAHMKLAMVLKDTGYNFSGEHRLNVFLTNTLEKAGNSDNQLTLFDDPLALESVEANKVKKNIGVNILIGNPPYSGESANTGEWAQALIESYKKEPGGKIKLQERNSKWINDDYVKFIKYAQSFVDESETGIVAYINPHGFSDNPTFRGMRWNLLESFSKIYILDLHGNSKKKEKSPDGSKDENVFDIQQGVCIFIAIKNGKTGVGKCEVYHADLYGVRDKKYAILNGTQIEQISWENVKYNDPLFLFKPREEGNRAKYESGFQVSALFKQNSIGVVSARDDVVVDFTASDVLKKIEYFCDKQYTDMDIREHFFPGKKSDKYLPGDTRGWSLSKARNDIADNDHKKYIQRFLYRPFDWRYIYYTKTMVDWSREQVMKNFISHENIALIVPRQTKDHLGCYITEFVCGHKTCSAYDVNTIFPVYVYNEEFGAEKQIPNYDLEIIDKISKRLDIPFVSKRSNTDMSAFDAYDVFDYMFAIINSSVYKNEYQEFLKSDFPYIPYPKSLDYFRRISRYGKELRENQLLHFEESECTVHGDTNCAVVEKPKHKGDTVVINKSKVMFKGIDEDTWNTYVGGYQPLQKWLQDRKGRTLSEEDIMQYRKMVHALRNAKRIVNQIDLIIDIH